MYVDLDLLIRKRDIVRIVALLKEHGYQDYLLQIAEKYNWLKIAEQPFAVYQKVLGKRDRQR